MPASTTRTVLFFLAAAALAFSTVSAIGAEPAGKKIPAILDTDIGGDIDDTWALVMALRSPELDLKMVVGDDSRPIYRARLIAKLLETAGRGDVAVGVGLGDPNQQDGPQAKWVEGYSLDAYPGKVHQDGVRAMIELIMNSPEPITLICIGPVPNIAEALRREPKIAQKARFVGMHGSVRVGYDGAAEPAPEWNVRADAASCRAVLSAPWRETVITPLDTCGLVRLDGKDYAKVRDCDDKLVRALIENYRIWYGDRPGAAPDRESSVLFDTVAIYLAFTQDLCKMEQVKLNVTDDGFTREAADGAPITAATAWKDLPAYKRFLAERLTSGEK